MLNTPIAKTKLNVNLLEEEDVLDVSLEIDKDKVKLNLYPSLTLDLTLKSFQKLKKLFKTEI